MTSIIIFVIGMIALIVGVVMLIIKLVSGPAVRDGEFLVSVGEWALEDDSAVVWNFTEIGKGKLTTNNHINDYDFLWSIEDGKLKIETKWLYQLNDEYEYELDQGNRRLTLNEETVFIGKDKTEEPEEESQPENEPEEAEEQAPSED